MSIDYQQEDTASVSGQVAACDITGENNSGQAQDYLCVEGGTPGVGVDTMGNSSGLFDQRCCYFEFEPAAATFWAAGLITVRIRVVGADAALTWETVQVCRLNSGGISQGLMGISDGNSVIMSPAGVKSIVVGVTEQPNNAGDRVFIICHFSSAGLQADQITMTPDQLISTPFLAASQTSLDQGDGRIVLGALSASGELEPRLRPLRPEGLNDLDIIIP